MTIGSHVRACVSICVITLNLVFWTLPVLMLGLLKWMNPGLGDGADACLEWIYRAALRIDDAWLKGVIGLRWQTPRLELSNRQNVIVLSNHVSWADILLIQSVIVGQGPILKFLAKRELIFIPILGAIFWAFDFPILRRTSREGESEYERRRRDLDAIKDACRVMNERPAALVVFAEGTRFTEAKRAAQNSAFNHLLTPKVGGFSALLDALGNEDTRVVDLTIQYESSGSFWEFLAGSAGMIEIDADVIAARELPKTREGRAEWLLERWSIKDRRIEDHLGRSQVRALH